MEVQAEEEQAFLARQQAALSGLKDPTRSPTTRNQASSGPVIQVIPFISGACSLHVACRIKRLQQSPIPLSHERVTNLIRYGIIGLVL